MIDPLFWLGMSILLVAVSLSTLLVVAIPTLRELARAARTAEKLFDILLRELPPTLDAIRMTSLEITDLTDDVSEGVRSASEVVKQVDQSLDNARKQVQNVQVGTRSVFVGVKTAWKTFTRQKSPKRTGDHLPPTKQEALILRRREALRQENRRTKGETPRPNDAYNDHASWDFDDEDLPSKPTVTDD
ncbi:MAG: DUF948 domain-containing protein [Rhizonema sp. NSF051]|nr:DUF948 domain-containing protein [Rhizonema sp. NSF051]